MLNGSLKGQKFYFCGSAGKQLNYPDELKIEHIR